MIKIPPATVRSRTSAFRQPCSRSTWVGLAFFWCVFGLVVGKGPVTRAGPYGSSGLPSAAAQISNSPRLRAQPIDAWIRQPRFRRASWGVQAVLLRTGRSFYAHDPNRLLLPASNAKLFIAALALERLGPRYRIRTSLFAHSVPDANGRLPGDLIVYGRGDPSFSTRFHPGDPDLCLQPFADALRKAGVRTILGDLVADPSYFRGPPFGSGWSWDDLQYGYAAPVSALAIEDNTAELIVYPGSQPGLPGQFRFRPSIPWLGVDNAVRTISTGGKESIEWTRLPGSHRIDLFGQIPLHAKDDVIPVSLADPAHLFVWRLKEFLEKQGIRIAGRARVLRRPEQRRALSGSAGRIELGAIESPPLEDLLVQTLKHSENLYAQLLLLQVGAHQANTAGASRPAAGPPPTTEQLGLAELNDFLGQAGIDPGAVYFEEGSGLSRGDLVTANAVVQLLRFMAHQPAAASFRQALPIAGVDGTLRHRFKGTIAAGRVQAKTGTLRFVHTLSGYFTTTSGEPVAFSILLNQYRPTTPRLSGTAAVDELLLKLMHLAEH